MEENFSAKTKQDGLIKLTFNGMNFGGMRTRCNLVQYLQTWKKDCRNYSLARTIASVCLRYLGL